MGMTREYKEALREKADRWIPAAGGTEEPFLKNGVRYLYCFNPFKARHAYLDLDSDVILTDAEALEVMG